MGGHAIKKNGVSICSRLARQHYELVKGRVVETVLRKLLCEVVLELPTKQDFGDLDVLYVSDPEVSVLDVIKQGFDVVDESLIVANGHITSFALECSFAGLAGTHFQIDMIECASPEHFRASRFYFSYGDLGCILGRMFHCHGLKFGNAGLWCDVVEHNADPSLENGLTLGKVILSCEPEEICKFAGLDYAQWEHEFPGLSSDTPIFEWVKGSRLFKPHFFLGDGNCAHRKRQTKRPFYDRFVTHIEQMHSAAATAADTSDCDDEGAAAKAHKSAARDDAMQEALRHFGKEAELSAMLAAARRTKARNEKLTGLDIIEAFLAAHSCRIAEHTIRTKKEAFKAYCLGRDSPSADPAGTAAASDPAVGDGDGEAGGAWERFLDRHAREEMLALLLAFARADRDIVAAPASARAAQGKEARGPVAAV